jgi:hypothetical protein
MFNRTIILVGTEIGYQPPKIGYIVAILVPTETGYRVPKTRYPKLVYSAQPGAHDWVRLVRGVVWGQSP